MPSYNGTMIGGPWHGQIRYLPSGWIAAGRFVPDDLLDGTPPGEYVRHPDAPHMWNWRPADPAEQASPARFEPLAKAKGLLTWVKRRTRL